MIVTVKFEINPKTRIQVVRRLFETYDRCIVNRLLKYFHEPLFKEHNFLVFLYHEDTYFY